MRRKSKSKDFAIVSVCPPSAYTRHIIPGSINIPLERLRHDKFPFPKERKVVLYSRTSAGAYSAYRYLQSQDYSNVVVLEGGYLFWRQAR